MNKYILILCLAFLFTGCSTTKVIDSWKSNDFQNIKRKKVLVVAKSPDLDIQKSYEKSIVSKLQGQHINAIEMHKMFPEIKNKETRSSKEVEQILRMFADKQIEVLLITSLKKSIETNSSSEPERGKIQVEKERKGFFTFEDYEKLKNLPDFETLEIDKSTSLKVTSTTYILESNTYDLTLEKEQQLVHVCLLDVVDPNSAEKVLNAFSRMISDEFKK